jgi:hypothetical protein
MKEKSARRGLRRLGRKIALANMGTRKLTKQEEKQVKAYTQTLVKGA